MNLVSISGYLTDNISPQQTRDGVSFCRFTVAVRRSSGKGVDYLPVAAFGVTADFAVKWFQKGSRMEVVGELRFKRFDLPDGKTKTDIYIEAKDIFFGERKRTGDNVGSFTAPENSEIEQVASFNPQFEELQDGDDLPF